MPTCWGLSIPKKAAAPFLPANGLGITVQELLSTPKKAAAPFLLRLFRVFSFHKVQTASARMPQLYHRPPSASRGKYDDLPGVHGARMFA